MKLSDWNPSIEFALHYGMMEYAADLDPREAWEKRGIAGHREEFESYRKERRNRVSETMKQERVRSRLEDLAERSTWLLEQFFSDGDGFSDFVDGDTFYVIIGETRTGGTYLQKEMSRALNWPMKDLLIQMIHDELPYGQFLGGESDEDLGWREPQNFYNAVFQFCQLLIYLDEEVPEQTAHVLKNINYACCLPLLDRLFGEQAEYVITVRHPAAVIASRLNWKADQEKAMRNREQYVSNRFRTWLRTYRSIAENSIPSGPVTTLRFGKEMDTFLKEFFERHDVEDEPEGIKITSRDYDETYWNRDEIQKEIREIESLWQLNSLEFPVPQEIK